MNAAVVSLVNMLEGIKGNGDVRKGMGDTTTPSETLRKDSARPTRKVLWAQFRAG